MISCFCSNDHCVWQRFAGDSVIFTQESVCEVFRFKFSKRTLDLGFSSFLVYTKGRVEKYNYREITPHIKSNLFSYQVKHVKTITIKKISPVLLKLKHNVFTLCSMYKGLPSHIMQYKPKSKNSAGDLSKSMSL